MIFAIPLLVSCAVSIWFCYWSTSVFKRLCTRPCRIACFATPFALAIPLLIFSGRSLAPLYDAFAGSDPFDLLGEAMGEFVVALAMVETVFTLLFMVLIDELSKLNGRRAISSK